MKKIIFFISVMAFIIFLSSCSKGNPTTPSEPTLNKADDATLSIASTILSYYKSGIFNRYIIPAEQSKRGSWELIEIGLKERNPNDQKGFFTIVTEGSGLGPISGDVDLFARSGSALPTTSSPYSLNVPCRSINWGTTSEYCFLPTTPGENIHIGLFAYTDHANHQLVASFYPTPAITNKALTVNNNGAREHAINGLKGESYTYTFDVPAGASDVQFKLLVAGNSPYNYQGRNPDLKVQHASQPMCISEKGPNQNESCFFSGANLGGRYYITIHAKDHFNSVHLLAYYTQ